MQLPLTMVAVATVYCPVAGEISSISAQGPTTRHSDSQWDQFVQQALRSSLADCAKAVFLCACLCIMNGRFCEKLAFVRAMITACVCARMRVLFCLS